MEQEKNMMRSIVLAEELVRKTHGINGKEITLKTFNMTDKHLTYSIEYAGYVDEKKGVDIPSSVFQATLTEKAVKPKFTLDKNEHTFMKEQVDRAFYIRGELFKQEDINGDLLEGLDYDPARGYINDDEKE